MASSHENREKTSTLKPFVIIILFNNNESTLEERVCNMIVYAKFLSMLHSNRLLMLCAVWKSKRVYPKKAENPQQKEIIRYFTRL